MDKQKTIEELLKHRYAHRGLHHKPAIPENSLLAFEKAAEKGFGIELDIHLTKDNKLAVMHDSGLRRVTSVRSDHLAYVPENAGIECEVTAGCTGIIEEMTLAEAKQYPLEESDERIPELREVLELINGRVPMIIELKPHGGNHEELCKRAVEELKDYEGTYCIESFNSFAVLTMKKKYPESEMGRYDSSGIEEQTVNLMYKTDVDLLSQGIYKSSDITKTYMDALNIILLLLTVLSGTAAILILITCRRNCISFRKTPSLSE